MMFTEPYKEYEALPAVSHALNLLLLLHADHEQNCSTSTVRMVGYRKRGQSLHLPLRRHLRAVRAALHGGANVAVMQMLQKIHDEGDDGTRFIQAAKSGDKGNRLHGLRPPGPPQLRPASQNHRARACGDGLLTTLGIQDPLLDIAKRLEQAALKDDYFIARKLYPNVDFYSGIIMRASSACR